MITESPKREFEIDYPISKVKETMLSTFQVGNYNLLDKNDIINTFRFSVVTGFNTGIISASIKKVSENTTHCAFEIHSTVGSRLQPATLMTLLDDYLKLFTNILSGQTTITQAVPISHKETNQKTMAIMIIIVAALVLMAFFVLSYT